MPVVGCGRNKPTDIEPYITPAGFQFLLLDTASQVWYFMLQYLETLKVLSHRTGLHTRKTLFYRENVFFVVVFVVVILLNYKKPNVCRITFKNVLFMSDEVSHIVGRRCFIYACT